MLDITKEQLNQLIINKTAFRYGLPKNWQMLDCEFSKIKQRLSFYEYDTIEKLEKLSTDEFSFAITIDLVSKRYIQAGWIVHGKYFFDSEFKALEHLKVLHRIPKNRQIYWSDFEDPMYGNYKFVS